MKIACIIPARFKSTRLPGKPLEMIGDKSLINRVVERCQQVEGFDIVVVATDDERILRNVEDAGGQAVMTSEHHGSGTERCLDALGKLNGDFDFVINVQGDEPFINPDQIQQLISCLDDRTQIATLAMNTRNEAEVKDPSIPKLVVNAANEAMYFSRYGIPFLRDSENAEWSSSEVHKKHIGIYAYRTDVLATIVDLPTSIYEEAEQLEQLRWLYNGFRIKVETVAYEEGISVDTKTDLENARKYAEKNGL